jgi:hypothetical protein
VLSLLVYSHQTLRSVEQITGLATVSKRVKKGLLPYLTVTVGESPRPEIPNREGPCAEFNMFD